MITASELGRLAARVKMAADPVPSNPAPHVMSVAGPHLPYIHPPAKPPVVPPVPLGMSDTLRDYLNGAESEVGSPAYNKALSIDAASTRTPYTPSTWQQPVSPKSPTVAGMPLYNKHTRSAAHGLGTLGVLSATSAVPRLNGPGIFPGIPLPSAVAASRVGSAARFAGNAVVFPLKHPGLNLITDAAFEGTIPRTKQQQQFDFHTNTLPSMRQLDSWQDTDLARRYPDRKMSILQALGEVPGQIWRQTLPTLNLASSPIGHIRNTWTAAQNPSSPQQQTLDAQVLGRIPATEFDPTSRASLVGSYLPAGIEGYAPPKITRTWQDYFSGEDPKITSQSTPAAQNALTARQITQRILLSNDPARIQTHAQQALNDEDRFKQLHPAQQQALFQAHQDAEVQRTPEYEQALRDKAPAEQLDDIRSRYRRGTLASQKPLPAPQTQTPAADLANDVNLYRIYSALVAAKAIPDDITSAGFLDPAQFQPSLKALIAAGKLDVGPGSPVFRALDAKGHGPAARALMNAALTSAGQ